MTCRRVLALLNNVSGSVESRPFFFIGSVLLKKFWFVLVPFLLSASPFTAQMFSLTSEEMVFASKLSDENRRIFCYSLSMQERKKVLLTLGELSPDERVEQVVALSLKEKEEKK